MRLDKTLTISTHEAFVGLPLNGTISAGYLRGWQDLVRSRGHDPRKILEPYALDSRWAEDPDQQIDCGTAINLLKSCEALLHDPLFGLRLAERQSPDVFGCAVTLARAAPTLREALQALIDYIPLTASPECELELVTGREIAELRWRTDVPNGNSEQTNYQGLLLMIKAMQSFLGPHFRPRYVTLTFKFQRSIHQAIQERVGCKVLGGAAAHAIAFPVASLNKPLATYDRLVFNLLGSYLGQARVAHRSSFLELVEAYVRRSLATAECTVDGCAIKVGTTARTLQKRLNKLDIKFSQIVLTERIRLAKHALLNGSDTLDEIAWQLGYSEQTSFGRAFKRITGHTPNEFRTSGVTQGRQSQAATSLP